MKMLKGDLEMELQEQLAIYKGILLEKMARVQEKEEIVEVMLVLAVGMLCGLCNPNQVARQLGISPKQFYERLKEMSLYHWKNLMKEMMMASAMEKLKQYEESSEATKSRKQASITIDDSLVKRVGKYLSYIWSWYSGQIHQVTKGQDLLGIVLKIEDQIIPLSIVLVSKQGSANTNKGDILTREMESLKGSFLDAGIDITNLGISFDSWWLGNKSNNQIADLGFQKQVISGKQVTQLKIGKMKKSVAEYFFEVELKKGWGHDIAAARLKGTNPELGKIAVVLFDKPRSNVFALIMPFQPLRTCEALRIWRNHPAVETFWKRLKHFLGHGKMQLQDKSGAWIELCLRILAYFLASSLFDEQVQTFNQLYHYLRKEMTFAQLIAQHFHLLFASTYILNHS
jgi:hypothetical protein